MADRLTDGPLWRAVVGGDDAVPERISAPLSEDFPGRDALLAANGTAPLIALASNVGSAIEPVRQGLLAALALGATVLRQVGVGSLQRSLRPDRLMQRAMVQIRSGDYFSVLGLVDADSDAQVHAGFAERFALLRLHLRPDDRSFQELLAELEEARDVLLDPILRAQYRAKRPLVRGKNGNLGHPDLASS
jgi:hypothetical protein